MFIMVLKNSIHQILGYRYTLDPEFQPQNRGLYSDIPYELKVQNDLDIKYDIFKNVEKIKYKDKFVTKKQMYDKYEEEWEKWNAVRRERFKKYGMPAFAQ